MHRWIVAAAIPLVFGLVLAACNSSGTDTTFGNGGHWPDKTQPGAQDEADRSAAEATHRGAEGINVLWEAPPTR